MSVCISPFLLARFWPGPLPVSTQPSSQAAHVSSEGGRGEGEGEGEEEEEEEESTFSDRKANNLASQSFILLTTTCTLQYCGYDIWHIIIQQNYNAHKGYKCNSHPVHLSPLY